MKLNSKKIAMIFSLFFILIVSLAMVSAEEIVDDSNLSLSDESQAIDGDSLEIGDDSLEISSLNQNSNLDDDSQVLQSENPDIANENHNEKTVLSDGNGYSISVKNNAVTENTNVKIIADVKKNGIPVSSGYARFLLWAVGSEGTDETVLVENGQGILNIKVPSASSLSYLKWNCSAAYYDEYGDYQVSTTFLTQIKRAVNPTTVITNNIIGKMDKKVTLTANVYDTDGLKVSAGTVTFTVNGKSYKVSVKNGKASKVITSPFVGLYTVKVNYNGVGAYKSSSSSFKLLSDLKIKSKYYKLLNVKKGAKKYYKITLTNYYTKKPVKNFKLKFKVKVNKKTWKTYTLKSNSKGIIKWSTKKLSKGTHNVVVKSAYKIFDLTMKGKIVVR